MIKIPATREGLLAIREVLSEGIHVNVTLIFSEDCYRDVADAYLSGLEARVAAGGSIHDIASVASFFVSRVDSICEEQIEEKIAEGVLSSDAAKRVLGKIGIANSKVAFDRFKNIFTGERFKKLQNKEGLPRVQRPLWASTGTKNPSYSEVLYVEELAGRDTVNTLPPHTLSALIKGATIEPRLENGLNEAKKVLEMTKELGIDLAACLDKLQVEGVKAFADSYQQLLDATERKCGQVAG